MNVEVRNSSRFLAELAPTHAHLPAFAAALAHGLFQLLPCSHPGALVYVRATEAMTVLVAANVTAAGASFGLDLTAWEGLRTPR